MTTYRDLIAWQKAIDLVARVYSVSGDFPKSEAFGLTSQIRRAAVSIPSNIAEGHGRHTPAEFKRFLMIALGSTREVETQVIIAGKLQFADRDELIELLHQTEEVAKLLNGLLRSRGK